MNAAPAIITVLSAHEGREAAAAAAGVQHRQQHGCSPRPRQGEREKPVLLRNILDDQADELIFSIPVPECEASQGLHGPTIPVLECEAFQGLRVPTFPVPECGAFQDLCGPTIPVPECWAFQGLRGPTIPVPECRAFQGLCGPTIPVPECGAFQGLCGPMCDTHTVCLLRPGCCDGPEGESRRGRGAAVTVQGATRLRQQRTNGTYSHFDSGANFLKNEQSELLSTQKLDRVCCRL